MNETNKAALMIAFAIVILLLLLFGGGTMTGATLSGGMMGNGAMGESVGCGFLLYLCSVSVPCSFGSSLGRRSDLKRWITKLYGGPAWFSSRHGFGFTALSSL